MPYRKALLLGVVILFAFPVVYSGELYDDIKIKSRAKRGYNNNGTVEYIYVKVDQYNNDLSDEELGSFNLESSRLREIHSRVKVNSDVDSNKSKLKIGTITTSGSRNLREIDNKVTINGDLESTGNSIEVGTVTVRSSGRVKIIRNRTRIEGNVVAD